MMRTGLVYEAHNAFEGKPPHVREVVGIKPPSSAFQFDTEAEAIKKVIADNLGLEEADIEIRCLPDVIKFPDIDDKKHVHVAVWNRITGAISYETVMVSEVKYETPPLAFRRDPDIGQSRCYLSGESFQNTWFLIDAAHRADPKDPIPLQDCGPKTGEKFHYVFVTAAELTAWLELREAARAVAPSPTV